MSRNSYIEVVIPCAEEQKELILAALDGAGYDSIMETEGGLNAYVLSEFFDEVHIGQLIEKFQLKEESVTWNEQEERNWNIEWENNFNPIVVDELCLIRAPFHNSGEGLYSYELIIQPKMSFGTGHHATTFLMIRNQISKIGHKNKKVMDAGCGTAILAVMAEKLGAEKVIAYDIDDWSIENAPENIELNSCHNIEILKGTIKELSLDRDFDIILANINKNVLLEEIPAYKGHLNSAGHLLLSGFYTEDIQDIDKVAAANGFNKINEDSRDRWACLLYKKIG